MSKYVIIFFLGFLGHFLHAQDTFSSEELKAFSIVYLDSKSKPIDSEEAIRTLLKKHNITPERYAALMKRSLTGEKITRSKAEQNFIDEIQILNVAVEKKKMEQVQEHCVKQRIDFQRYQKILANYKSDIQFQRSLKPYFDQQIKNR